MGFFPTEPRASSTLHGGPLGAVPARRTEGGMYKVYLGGVGIAQGSMVGYIPG